ncbi:MAG TPA: carboxypeptidase-like regulatory domain-containing protein, partial [Verrucomicrobiae bacterium]|nr:carboxypeptidase-like regulatory domain-containing protein [Verrucomicrobiae bacterium]
MIRRSLAALLTFFLLVPSLARAGTTGGLSGTVVDGQSKAPIAGAKVTVASASQIASETTDASGHFAFVSLEPDEY